MGETDAFDAFYKSNRDALLLQTYLAVGDLSVARGAVRESFVIAWHHWPKINALHDPTAEVRSRAWTIAQHRSSARPWHKEKDPSPEVAATLAALEGLDALPRHMLVLAEAGEVALGEASRECNVTLEDGARHLAIARAEFAQALDTTNPAGAAEAFAAVAASLADVRWSRPSILRRAGARRRRIHTVAGVTLAVAAVVIAGVVVHDAAGTPTSLIRTVERSPGGGTTEEPISPERFSADLMLTNEEVMAVAPETTFTGDMTDNTGGDGLVLPCQQSRYADVDGLAGYLSTFASAEDARPGPVQAYQVSELSQDAEGAAATYDTWRTWFAGCDIPRAHLVDTLDVTGVGDEAAAFVIAVPDDPSRIITGGVARTGDVTTVVTSDATEATSGAREAVADLLATAVTKLCEGDDSRTCNGEIGVTSRLPFPVGENPEMLDLIDLPPVGGVSQPWSGTLPTSAAETNDASTACDQTTFEAAEDPLTRTFVIPDAGLPDAFGLTQTIGNFADGSAAETFLRGVAERMSACTEQDLVTSVDVVGDETVDDGRIIVWRAQLRAGEDETVSILMGIARSGSVVTQVGFVPGGESDLDDQAFVDAVVRAQQRAAVAAAAAEG